MSTRTHQLLSLRLGDTPDSWEAAGFEVERMSDGTGVVFLGATTVVLDSSGHAMTAWAIDGVAEELDGIAAMEPVAPPSAGAVAPRPAHRNGIVGIDHVVVNTGDVDRTVAAFEGVGIAARGGRSTTSYGSPMRQVFLWAGDVILEVVGPDEGEPRTQAPASVFGLALVAADLDATAAALGDLLGTPKDAVQPGRRIAGLRNSTVGISLPIAVMSPHVRA